MTLRTCALIAAQTVAIVLALIFATGAYEGDTHRLITSEAVNRSVLNAGYLEEQLASRATVSCDGGVKQVDRQEWTDG